MKKWMIGIIALIVLLLIGKVSIAMQDLAKKMDQQNLSQAEEVIRKATIQCYALEGSFPPDIDYLEDNYGIMINRDAFIYHYEAEASNIMPNIQVFKNWREDE